MTQERDHLAAKMKRGEVFDAACGSREVLTTITGKWSVLVLIALRDGPLRFAQLRRRVNGVSERMLAESLRQLAKLRLLTRRSLEVTPPHVDYTLTPLGRQAADHLVTLTDWIETHMEDFAEPVPQ